MKKRMLLAGSMKPRFVAVFDTRNVLTGSSASNQITLSFVSALAANVTIYWGDGTFEVYTGNGDLTHTYATEGLKVITIFPLTAGGRFNLTFFNKGDRNKLTEISNWTGFMIRTSSFRGCVNLKADKAEGVPSFSGTNPLAASFASTTSLTYIKGLEKWDVSGQTNVNTCFSGSAINQDISMLNWSNVTNFSNFLTGKNSTTFLPQYVDSFYQKLDAGGKTGVTLGMGAAKYTSAGATARASLITKGWTITDGGLI